MSAFVLKRIISSVQHRQPLTPIRRTVPAFFSASTSSPPNNGQSIRLPTAFALVAGSLLGGYCLGTSHTNHLNEINKDRELPKGERGCCSCDAASSPKKELTEAQKALPGKLAKIVGKQNVHDGLVKSPKNAQFLKAARLGEGFAVAIVQPGTLGEAVKCLQEVVDAGCVVVPQGSNTGLTGG